MGKRFIRRGKTKFLFSPTIADIHNVTREEIDDALDLTPEVADVSGFMLENNAAATPDFSSTFEKSIPGTDSAADSSFTMYEDELTETTETALAKNTEGFVIILRKGDRPTSKSMDVFPARVASKGSEFNAGNEPARYAVNWAITDEPALDKTIPAAA